MQYRYNIVKVIVNKIILRTSILKIMQNMLFHLHSFKIRLH